MKNRLTQKQETFCLKYFELGNASEAARIAKYSPKTAAVIGRENLLKPKIQTRIAELRQHAEDATRATVAEIERTMTAILRVAPTDVMELSEDGRDLTIKKEALKSPAVSYVRTEQVALGKMPVRVTRIGMADKIRAAAFMPTSFGKVAMGAVTKGLVTTARIGGKLFFTGLTEGGEEIYQEMLQKQALGETLDLTGPEAQLVFSLGAAAGIGMGAGGDIIVRIQNRVKDQFTPEQQIQFDTAKADNVKQGLAEDIAEHKALDTVVEQNPELEKVVEDAAKAVEKEITFEQIKPKDEADKIAFEHLKEQAVGEIKPPPMPTTEPVAGVTPILTQQIWDTMEVSDRALLAKQANLEVGTKAWADLTTEEQDAIRLAREEIAPAKPPVSPPVTEPMGYIDRKQAFQLGKEINLALSQIVDVSTLKPSAEHIKQVAQGFGIGLSTVRKAIDYYNYGSTYAPEAIPRIKSTEFEKVIQKVSVLPSVTERVSKVFAIAT